MPVTGDKPGVNRTTFRPPWVKEPGTAATPSQIAKKNNDTTPTVKTAPAWAKKPADTANAKPSSEIKLKSTLLTKKAEPSTENGAKEAIKNVKLQPVTKKAGGEQTKAAATDKSILKPILKPVGTVERRTSVTIPKTEEESELEKKFKIEKPKLRPVMSVKKTESFSKKPEEIEKSKSSTKNAAPPSKTAASKTPPSKTTPVKTPVSTPTPKTTVVTKFGAAKLKPKAKTPTPPSSSDEEEDSEEESEEEEEETEEEEESEEESEEEEETEEESEEEQQPPPKPTKPAPFINKKSLQQQQTQNNNKATSSKIDEEDEDEDEDDEGGDGRRHSRIKFEKPKLRHVVINKQKSFNKSIDEFEKIRPVLKKTPKIDESKTKKDETKPEFVDVDLKPVPPKPADKQLKKSRSKIVPPPPPPPPPSGVPPPPPPPPFAPPSDFEKKELSNKQKQTLEKLKARPRRRPDWSDMMKEVEQGRKLKHVECNDRSKPILAISKSVTKVDGQFVFETEKANVHNKLLKQIQSGVRLKPTKTNDRSKPVLEGLRKFRRQMTIEEQIQKSESKAVLNKAADIPDEVLEDSPDEMDDIDKLRDDLQSTKQMLALELRNKETQERENKRLLAKIANLEAELASGGGGSGGGGSGGASGIGDGSNGDGSGKVNDSVVKQYKKDADNARKETKVIEKKYNDTAEQLDVAKGQVEEQRRKIADLEKKLMQAVQGHNYKNYNGSTTKFSYYGDENNEYNSNSNYQGIIPSSSSSRRQSTAVGKESSPELEFEESEDGEDDTEEDKEARKSRRLEREVKFLRTKLEKLVDKEMAAKKEKANIKEAMKKNQNFLKQETKKLKKLEKEVAKMAATMTLDEEDEENGHEEKDEPEDEEEATESEESETESEEDETESESEESEAEDASNEDKKANLEPRVKKHEGRLTALKKTNFLLQTNVDRLQDEINLTREKAASLQQELDAVVADFGF